MVFAGLRNHGGVADLRGARRLAPHDHRHDEGLPLSRQVGCELQNI
jgi:hypothetical protein